MRAATDSPRPEEATDLAVNGARVRLWTRDRALAARVAAALATDPLPAAGPAALEYEIEATPAQAWRVRQAGQLLHEGSAAATVGWLESAIARAAAERLAGWWRLHAGAVVHQGGAVLLPAASHAGKSTLVAALLRAGFGYLSDEVALVDDRGRAHPFVKAIGLRAGSWRLIDLPERTPTALRLGERVRYLDPRPWLAAAPDGYPITAVVLLDRAGGDPALTPLPKGEALLALLRQTGASRQMGFALVERAVALAAVTPAFRLTLGPDLPRCVGVLREGLSVAAAG
jgi:hypothetical protein